MHGSESFKLGIDCIIETIARSERSTSFGNIVSLENIVSSEKFASLKKVFAKIALSEMIVSSKKDYQT